jgi:hypothetical protein
MACERSEAVLAYWSEVAIRGSVVKQTNVQSINFLPSSNRHSPPEPERECGK